MTLAIVYLAAIALAVAWTNQKALAGPWPAYSMLAVLLICFIVVRPFLRRLVPKRS